MIKLCCCMLTVQAYNTHIWLTIEQSLKLTQDKCNLL